jgi:alkylated DNA nucleotide flippase Atl1
MNATYDRIEMVRRIPKGRVMTYGQIALLSAFPDNPAGSVMLWRRFAITNRFRGIESSTRKAISRRAEPGCEAIQQTLLESEGSCSIKGRIPLAQFCWRPKDDVRNSKRKHVSRRSMTEK